MKMIGHASTLFGMILAILVSVSVSYYERVTKWDEVKYKETMSKYEQVLQKPNTALYKRLAKEAKNATRDVWVQETLKRAAGVYKDKARGKELGIEKTVFISVIAYPVGAHHYKVYFRNFLCFIHHYRYDLVVYVVHQGDVDPDVEIQSLRKLGVSPLTYPDELFWKVVSNKMQPIHQGATYAKYNGTKVSFQEFGALPMLVPALEVLEYGYNIIYFDVDIALVHDPVPYLIRGDADFVASIENRACREEYYGMVPSKIDWERIEPNTGIMHLRATKQGLKFFAWWLERIVVRFYPVPLERPALSSSVTLPSHSYPPPPGSPRHPGQQLRQRPKSLIAANFECDLCLELPRSRHPRRGPLWGGPVHSKGSRRAHLLPVVGHCISKRHGRSDLPVQARLSRQLAAQHLQAWRPRGRQGLSRDAACQFLQREDQRAQHAQLVALQGA